MKILGIETSCDETAAAVVEDGKTVLSSALATSSSLHVKTGGIIPEVAARKQIESIIPVIEEALVNCHSGGRRPIESSRRDAIASLQHDIDAIAVTYGPGLIGSLLVGVETAKTLALVWNKPIIPVNHLVAHIYANFVNTVIPSEAEESVAHETSEINSEILRQAQDDKLPQFPAIALVVSGGHTDFVLIKSHGDIKYLGGTRDDAAGEAFDKTARLLGLPYPGGPEIAKAAEKYLGGHSGGRRPIDSNGNEDAIASLQHDMLLSLFPRPMINEDTIDTSFSGLKTAVLKYTKEYSNFDKNHLAAEIQEAIVDTLVAKSLKAVEIHKPKSFLLAGGVSANKRLGEKITEELSGKTEVFIPEPKYSTDNAVMIAAAAFYNYKPIPWEKVTANPSLSIEEGI